MHVMLAFSHWLFVFTQHVHVIVLGAICMCVYYNKIGIRLPQIIITTA